MSVTRFDIGRLTTALQNGSTILVPNHRSCDAIIYTYAQQQAKQFKAWLAPEVYAVDVWIMNLCEQLADLGIAPFHRNRILNKHEELFLWHSIVEASHTAYPLINPAATAQALSRTFRLHQQWISPQSEKPLTDSSQAPDVAAYSLWVERFKSQCQKKKVMVLSDAVTALMGLIGKPSVDIPCQLLLVNFLNPPPIYQSLFRVLAQHSKVSQIQTGIQYPKQQISPVRKRYRFSEFDEEIRACVQWVVASQKSTANAHIAIVASSLGDNSEQKELLVNLLLEQLEPVMAGASDDGNLPFNDLSKGSALDSNQSIDTALRILALNHKKHSTKDFCQLISNPLIVGTEEEFENRIRLHDHYRRYHEGYGDLAGLRQPMLQETKDHYCPVLAKALLDFQQLVPQKRQKKTALVWATLFQEQLQLMGWTSAAQEIEAENTLRLWQECLNLFRRASDLLGSLGFTSALQHLSAICNNTIQNNRFRADCSVSLMSATDAVGLHYSHVWVLAMDDQDWPGPARPDPFLPINIQRKYDMPGNSTRWQLQHAKTTLTQLLASTKIEFVVSHHSHRGDLILHESPILKNHPWFQNTPMLDDNGSPQELKPHNHTPLRLEQIEDCIPVPLATDESVHGGSSLLSDQSSCPFRAFARHRLGARALPEFESGLTSRARGTALHIALQSIWQELASLDGLLQAAKRKVSQVIENGIVNAISWLRRNYPETLTPSIAEIEALRLRSLLEDYLLAEKSRSPFTVLATEKSSRLAFDKFSLELTLDRIDQLTDGSLVLIDYKTGKQINDKWLDPRPADLQLPLYQLAITKESTEAVEAILISQINAQKIRYVGESKHTDIHPDLSKRQRRQRFDGNWTELQQYWNSIISDIAEEVTLGICTVTPTNVNSSCQYCDLSRLCRIKQTADPAQLKHTDSDQDD